MVYDVRVSEDIDVVFVDQNTGEFMTNVLLRNIDEADIQAAGKAFGDQKEYFACVNGLEDELISTNGGYLPAEVERITPTMTYDVKYVNITHKNHTRRSFHKCNSLEYSNITRNTGTNSNLVFSTKSVFLVPKRASQNQESRWERSQGAQMCL